MKKMLPQYITIISLSILLCYTLCCQKKGENLTEEEKNNLVCFIDSIHLRNKAMSMLQVIPSTSIVEVYSPENLKKIETALGMMKESIEESQKVNDQTLDKLHPDLSRHYREEFCKGLKIYIEFLEEGGVSKEEKSKQLEKKWGKWFIDKFDSISKRSKWFLNEFARRQPDYNS